MTELLADGSGAVSFPDDPVAAARAVQPLVEATREAMQRERRLSEPVVQALQRMGALRMAVPHELRGPQWDPVTQIRVVEELSRIDGSVGWCAMIAGAGSFVSGFLEPESARRHFASPEASLAGQIAPTGRADRVEGGYRVSGRFRFASGNAHATIMIAGCLVHEGGEPARHANGRPRICSAIFPPSSCTILDTWDTTGLWATGSHDYVVEELFVAEEDTWDPAGPMRRSEPLYRYPPLFLVSHCGVPLGIGRAAIDEVLALAGDKEVQPNFTPSGPSRRLRDDGRTQEAVAVAEATLGAARALTYETIEDLWSTLVAGSRPTPRQRAMYRITMSWIHQAAKEVVESMYDTASGSAIYRTNPLDRLMRDILTACQHRVVHPRVFRPAGRLLLDMESGDPMV
jgi:alkylation response protein AidB-like acyl-CoA dehydrogenase